MPDHRTHRRVERLLLGREFPWVHREKDALYPILGPRHRIYGHDFLFDLLLFLRSGDPRVLASALLHDALDMFLRSSGQKKKRWKAWKGHTRSSKGR